jgi:hypothetical protein
MESGEPPPPPPPPQPPTPEQQQAMALEQKKAAEQQQANIELARKNELEDQRLQLDVAKFQMERQTLPEIAQLQEQLRAAEASNAALQLKLQAAEVGHTVEKGALQLQNLDLQHKINTDQSGAGLVEKTQKNIETARANEIAQGNLDLERRKVALEHQKLTQGGHADAQAAKAALDEQVQTNIATVRAQEQAERDHGFKLSQAARDEELSKRQHDIAMNPPPGPAPASKAAIGGAPAGEAAPSAGDIADHPAIAEIKHVVSDLSEKVHGKPDYTPLIAEALHKLANQRRPIGTTRTKDGLRLVFDETPGPPTGAAQ